MLDAGEVRCVVCGEPTYLYDMAPWELDLFRKGSGCPSCKGRRPVRSFEPISLGDFSNGDGDECERIFAWQDSLEGKTPEWKRPKPKVLWTCACCGIEVLQDPDFDPIKYPDLAFVYNVPRGSNVSKWYSSHHSTGDKAEEEPHHIFNVGTKEEQPVCDCCISYCDHCGKAVCPDLADDISDETWGAVGIEGYNYNQVFCYDCVSLQCEKCKGIDDECTCIVCGCGERNDDHASECESCGTKLTDNEDDDE